MVYRNANFFLFLMIFTQVRYLGTQNLVSVAAHVITFFPLQMNSPWHKAAVVLVEKDISALRMVFFFSIFWDPFIVF